MIYIVLWSMVVVMEERRDGERLEGPNQIKDRLPAPGGTCSGPQSRLPTFYIIRIATNSLGSLLSLQGLQKNLLPQTFD